MRTPGLPQVDLRYTSPSPKAPDGIGMATLHSHHPPEDCLNCEHRHLRMFCNLTPEALADYDQIGIMMSHARGAKLFSEGDPARNVFVICFGQVKISSTSREGKTMILKIAGPGDVMGLSAVLANVPHEVTAEAIEPCQVKTVRKQEFVEFLGRHGIASMHAAQSLSGEYLTVFHDAKRLALSGSAAGRLARLLLDWGRASANGKPSCMRIAWKSSSAGAPSSFTRTATSIGFGTIRIIRRARCRAFTRRPSWSC